MDRNEVADQQMIDECEHMGDGYDYDEEGNVDIPDEEIKGSPKKTLQSLPY